MLNGISNAVSTIGRHLTGVASRVGSAGVSGFSVAPQTVRLTPVRFHSLFLQVRRILMRERLLI